MHCLNTAKQAQVVAALVEGNSINSTSRIARKATERAMILRALGGNAQSQQPVEI